MDRDLDRLLRAAGAANLVASLPGRHVIDGQPVLSQDGRTLEVFDPGTGTAFASVAAGGAAEIDAAVASARRALTGPWGRLKPAERGRLLAQTAALIRRDAERLATVESLDSGKPVREARGDIAGAARAFEYYAGACDKLQGDTLPLGADYLGFTEHEPIGVTAHILPWNYPLSTTARGLAPALAAGCTAVVKPAEQTPLTALMLAALLAEAGLPPGVCNVVAGTGTDAGAPLVAHPGVDHITFTGSVPTGGRVMQAAAANVTRLLLELGGKSPVVVLGDCDLDAAVDGVMEAIFENAGQTCSAGSRLIVEGGAHDALVDRLLARVRAMRLGHGLRAVDMGPLASAEQLARVTGHVDRAKARGAAVLTGGDATVDPETGKGWFFQPTLLDGLAPADEAVQQEIFGPVLTIQSFEDLDEAVALANGTAYGLVAGVYTRDLTAAHRLARRIDAGQIFINEYFAGGIEVPFGGNKQSGFGREKGLEALRSYSKLKSVVARL